jgi:hypothetical protein
MGELTRDGTILRNRRNHTLLERLCIDFSDNVRPTNEEVLKFKELFYVLSAKANVWELFGLSSLLAPHPYLPKTIVFFFALSDIEIATPMILQSGVIKDADIANIIAHRGFEYAKLAAARKEIGATAFDAILKSADDFDQFSELKNILIENTHIFDPRALHTSLSKAERNLPTPMVEETALRKETLEQPSSDSDLSSILLNLASKGGKLGQQRSQRQDNETFSDTLLRHARNQDTLSFAMAIEKFCGLMPTYTMLTIEDQNAGALASILRGMEIQTTAATRIMLLLVARMGRQLQVMKLVRDSYHKLDPQACREFLHKHGARFEKIAETTHRSERLTTAHRDRSAQGSLIENATTPNQTPREIKISSAS